MKVGGLWVESVSDRTDGPIKWTLDRDVHVLYLYEAGSYHWLETWLDDRRTSLGDPLPGEMWLAPAGRRYHGEAQGGSVRYVEVHIPADRLTVAASARAIAGHYDVALAALVRALAAGDSAAADPIVAILVKTLEARVVRADSPAVIQRMNDLMAYIQTQLELTLNVEEMAARAGMSVNSLIVYFARATGYTPAQYMLRQRLRRACWFLMNRPLSVAEIAFASGFSSHAHLCAIFRRKLGMSPGQWRRAHIGAMMPPVRED